MKNGHPIDLFPIFHEDETLEKEVEEIIPDDICLCCEKKPVNKYLDVCDDCAKLQDETGIPWEEIKAQIEVNQNSS